MIIFKCFFCGGYSVINQFRKEEGNEEKQTDSSEQDDNAPKPFAQLDLREASCFGWERDPKQKCWYNKCLHAKTVGWKNADVQGI